MIFSFLLKNQKFVISRMVILYIHGENIYSELNKTKFMIKKFYWDGLK